MLNSMNLETASLGKLTSRNAVRIILIENEVYRVADAAKKLRVVTGRAWISVDGRDVIANRGDEVRTVSNAVVSALGRVPLVVEIC